MDIEDIENLLSELELIQESYEETTDLVQKLKDLLFIFTEELENGSK